MSGGDRWSARIPGAKSTFGNTPDKLNFAFLGTLTVILSGGNLGAGVTDTLTCVDSLL